MSDRPVKPKVIIFTSKNLETYNYQERLPPFVPITTIIPSAPPQPPPIQIKEKID
jgi:hypothetical protein